MKKIILTCVAMAAMTAAPALAQTRAVVPAPAPIPVWNWTGYYAGVNLGYSWGQDKGPMSLNSGAFSVNIDTSLNGIVGGGQFGYNWQVSNWVYGFEFDFQGTGQDGSASITCPGGGTTATTVNSLCARGHRGDTVHDPARPVTSSIDESLEWFGTVRGRFGVLVTPTLLPYITGGLAYGQVKLNNRIQGVNVFGSPGANGATFAVVDETFSMSKTKAGWTIGAGLEGVLVGNWTGKIEYLYVDLGTVSGTFTTSLIGPGGGAMTSSVSSHVTDHIVRIGVNYVFR